MPQNTMSDQGLHYLLTGIFMQNTINKTENIRQKQRCHRRIRVIPYTGILYYKVYNSSCSQVGHDLIDRLQSLPEQIKVTAYICKHILCDDGSASSSDTVNMVYQIMSYLTAVLVAYLVLNIEYVG